VKGAALKVYPGLPHGMCSTHKDLINADLLEFIGKAQTRSQAALNHRRCGRSRHVCTRSAVASRIGKVDRLVKNLVDWSRRIGQS